MESKNIKELLNEGVYWEETFLEKYDTPHIWELLKTLDDEKYKKIKELLKENLDDTQKHKNILKSLLKKVD